MNTPHDLRFLHSVNHRENRRVFRPNRKPASQPQMMESLEDRTFFSTSGADATPELKRPHKPHIPPIIIIAILIG